MGNRRFISEKLWLLGLLLASFSFLNYQFKFLGKYNNELLLVLYCSFFIFTLILMKEYSISINKKLHGFFIIAIVGYNFVMQILYNTHKFEYVYNQSLRYFFIFIITMIGFSFIKSTLIHLILKRYYFIAFMIGLFFLFTTSLEVIDRNKVLNENTWGFFLAPYLIFLLVNKEGLLKKGLIYSIGIILIYFSDAKTALVAFVTLPLYIIIFNRIKRPRFLVSLIILFGFFVIYWLTISNNDLVTRLLAYRNILWELYLGNVVSTMESIIQGTGRWNIMDKGVPLLYGLGSHNTFISILHFNGIIVLVLYLLFIIFGIRPNSKRFTVSDGIIYLALIFQFAESNVPLFSFIFPAYIFMANMLINKESEEAERRLEVS